MRMMVAAFDTNARKRPVNLTLNADLVDRVRGITDNLSVVAMTWEGQDNADVADTQQLEVGFTTSSNTTEQLEGKGDGDADVTEEDIERAINEIQDAIRRVPR